MTPASKRRCPQRSGAALILSMIFVVLCSTVAISMATLSGTNVQVAQNQQQVNCALASAHSGLEIVRYYIQGISVPASVAAQDRLEAVADELQTAFVTAGITNMSVGYDAANHILTIPNVALNSQTNQSFDARVTYAEDFDTVSVVITGSSRDVDKLVGVNYGFATVSNPIFDFGIATKGPLNMQGNVDVEGYNENIEASVYIESLNSTLALEMTGKSAIAGDVSIANRNACVDIGNSSSVHGATGDAAMEYVTIGADRCEFPVPDPTGFEPYIQHTFDPDQDPTSNVTLTNTEIAANANPVFSGHAIIRGIMYIRAPNVVRFTGNAEIHGLILAEGDLDNPSADNLVDFGGTVDSHDVSTLLQEEFGALTEETGTFILAPGFSVCFRGNFETLNGVIAASGVEFHGNAGGRINGSVINYSDQCMTLAGNTDLVFNRSGMQEVPAGFEPTKVLECLPNSYTEPTL